MERLSESAFNRPSHLSDAVRNNLRRESHLSRPLCQCVGFSSKGDEMIAAGVVVLLNPCTPNAVPRTIRAVYIEPVYRPIRWTLSHISEKGLKRIDPTWAYDYSAPTIVAKTRRLRVKTSLFQASPYPVGSRLCHTVGSKGSLDSLDLHASTVGRFAPPKKPLAHYMNGSALALAHPSPDQRMRVTHRFGFFQDSPVAKPLARKVHVCINTIAFAVEFLNNAVRHGDSPVRTLCSEQPSRAVIPSGCSHYRGIAV